jgi:hypothetical protein
MSDKTNIPIKFSKEVSDFIEATAAFSDAENRYYWFQHYFKKVGDCLFEIVQFNDSNGELKHIVERSEDPNPEDKVL